MFESIQIQTIQHCNLQCDFCPNSKLVRDNISMDDGLFSKIVDNLANIGFTGRIAPYLMNEPTLDTKLVDRIKEIRERLPSVEVMINSNGTLLTRDYAQELVDAGLNHLCINHYHGKDPDRYKKMMASFVGVCRFQLRIVDEEFKRKFFYNRGGNVDIHTPGVEDTCLKPFKYMYVNVFGQAVLCCSDWKYEVLMGDVNESTLEGIWRNEIYRYYREEMKHGWTHHLSLCRKCNYYKKED